MDEAVSHLVSMTDTCALDLADRGRMSGEEVARALHTTRRSVIAEQRRALDKIERKYNREAIRDLIELSALLEVGRRGTS